MKELRVKDVMTSLVVTFRPEDTIPEAARRLLANRISGAPVVKSGRLVGVVSEADLVKAYAPPARQGSPFFTPYPLMLLLLRGETWNEPHSTKVGEVMTKDVISIGPDESIWEAASRIDHHGVRRLPVIDADNVVIGIVSRSDLVRSLARTDQDIAADVRDAIDVLGVENFDGLDIEADKGLVSVSGMADRRTTKELAIRIASRVPGVLEVSDRLDWEFDDTSIEVVGSPRNPNGIRHEPWIVQPRVEEAG